MHLDRLTAQQHGDAAAAFIGHTDHCGSEVELERELFDRLLIAYVLQREHVRFERAEVVVRCSSFAP